MSVKLVSGIAIGAAAIGGLGVAGGVVNIDKKSNSYYNGLDTTKKNSSDYRAEYSNKDSYQFDHLYDLDCGDFNSQKSSQIALEETVEIFGEDRHFLDGNADGKACESYNY